MYDKLQDIILSKGCTKSEAETLLSEINVYKEELNHKVTEDLKEIRDVHNAFLDHNTEIDHILLNTGTREDLVAQMVNLLEYYGKNQVK